MKIIIPIGGIGERFKNENFELPKPLINVMGKPMVFRLIQNIEIGNEDELHIVYNSILKNYNFESLLNHSFPEKKIKFHVLNKSTNGASETVLECLKQMDEKDLTERVLILDCDTFYEENLTSVFKKNEYGNLIFYFSDKDTKPIFSYIKTNKLGRVVSIKEKKKISNKANVGAYGFVNGSTLKKYCEKVLNDMDELYISKVYEELIKDDHYVDSKKVKKFNCVGTPNQLKIYTSNNSDKSEKLRFCFDLDNTLVTLPKIVGDYESVEPIWKNINYLKFLKNIGHTIIIHTARRMKTHNGNVGAVISDIGPVTIETLKKYEIPYDELYFGKPYAHFYIDDLAVNANSNLENFIGIHNIQTKPRHFNEVDIKENTVEKKTSNLGEIYWYRNIPEKILNLFPKIINYSDNRLTIEKINGVTFSYLFTHKTLNKTNITHLLTELEKIHNSLEVLEKINVYQNYYEKLKERYYTNFDLYSKYDLEKTFSVLETLLLDYELKNEGTPRVIHGDTVFTNIILTETNDIKFIDMRGKLGEQLTIYGDKYYDYSKIYQSLLGYDFILNDMEIDTSYCEELLNLFESIFSEKELKKIKMITASLFFSLIPLHEENHSKYKKYIMIIENLIQDLSKTTI